MRICRLSLDLRRRTFRILLSFAAHTGFKLLCFTIGRQDGQTQIPPARRGASGGTRSGGGGGGGGGGEKPVQSSRPTQ